MTTPKTYFFYTCLALIAFALTGCVKENIEAGDSGEGNRIELTVTQSNGTDTRLALGQNGLTTEWEPGDKLVLVNKSRTKAPILLTCTLSSNSSSATFVSESGVPADDYWVIYNYNENLAYTHQRLASIDDINSNDKLVLYGEVTITASTYSAAVTMKHLYAKINIKMKNIPGLGGYTYQYYTVGMYSSKKGMPLYSMFTPNGLVNAEYGRDPSSLNGYNLTYFKSDRTVHNLPFGSYNIRTSWGTGDTVTDGDHLETNLEYLESCAALVLPQDLSNEDVFFYVLHGDFCYEFKKGVGAVNLEAGKSYNVVLDFAEATESIISMSSGYPYRISSNAEWRQAVYRNEPREYLLSDNLDFTNDYFFPIIASSIEGNGKTISNINLDWQEDNVGLYRGEEHIDAAGSEIQSQTCRISNLTLKDVTFKGENYVGAFGGYNVIAENCVLAGNSTIAGTGRYVGGIAGWNSIGNTTLNKVSVGQNCRISGTSYVGGIIGAFEINSKSHSGYDDIIFSSSYKPFDTCISAATVTATGDYAGGVFGKVGGNGNDSFSRVSFSMEDYTFSLLKCQNKGIVTGRHYVGGIGGAFGIIPDTYNENKDKVILSSSYSEGTVTGENYVGGILGSTSATVNTCYSTNTITGADNVGGIAGIIQMSMSARIANCYSLATLTVSPDKHAGGIVGYASGGMGSGEVTIEHSYFAGSNPQTSGIVGHSLGLTVVNKCLTVLPSLGINLGEHIYDIENDEMPPMNMDDIITDSHAGVTSILANISVINSENAYSTNIWEGYPYECVKFASFQADVDAPGFGNGGNI